MSSQSPQPNPKSTSLDIPPVIIAALRSDPLAKLAFDKLSHSHKREYILWILGAKQEESRNARAKTMLTMLTSQAKDAQA